MPFDSEPAADPRPERPQRCDCLIVFGRAVYDDTGRCLECGGTNMLLGMEAPKLKAVIVELGQVGMLTPAEAEALIAYYGLRGA